MVLTRFDILKNIFLNILFFMIILFVQMYTLHDERSQKSNEIAGDVRNDFISGNTSEGFHFLGKKIGKPGLFAAIEVVDLESKETVTVGDRDRLNFNRLNISNVFYYSQLEVFLYYDISKRSPAYKVVYYYSRWENFKFVATISLMMLVVSFIVQLRAVRARLFLENERNRQKKNLVIAQTTQMLAHDLKGPLAIFEAAIYGQNSPDQKKSLESALFKLQSMASSIKNADLEAIVRPSLTDFSLDQVIEQAKVKAETVGIEIVATGSELPRISIDLLKVERSISNLLFNAIEAANTKVLLRWNLENTDLLITVEDDGPGVPRDFIPQLFQKGATFGKNEGTGLGLAFVRHTAQGHGGSIDYSRAGRRSVFKLTLKDVYLPERDHIVPKLESVVTKKSLFVSASFLDHTDINQISSELGGMPITNSTDQLSDCRLAYTDDVDLFADVLADSGVQVIMAHKVESTQMVLEKLKVRLNQ